MTGCDSCQRRKIAPTAGQGLYQPLPVSERVFETFHVDLLGRMPNSNGYNYCVVAIDMLSKMVVVEPIKTGTADEVLEAILNRIILRFGVPTTMISDRAPNLASDYCRRFYAEFGLRHVKTTAFHPQCNAPVERFNKVLGAALAQFALKSGTWSDYCYYIEFAYNTAVNSVTKLSPFEIVYGLPPKLPIEGQLSMSRLIEKE